jgi:Ca2+-binding EF-hand superfamily protein
LSYKEFKDAFNGLSYGLKENDINMLISVADENHDEKIEWREFLPVGIKMIKTIYSRNLSSKHKEIQGLDP